MERNRSKWTSKACTSKHIGYRGHPCNFEVNRGNAKIITSVSANLVVLGSEKSKNLKQDYNRTKNLNVVANNVYSMSTYIYSMDSIIQ